MQLAWTRLEEESGHSAAYALLESLVGAPLPEICRTSRGKPYFQDDSRHFSISHTLHHAFCCVSEKNVGIDAEEIGRKINLRLAQRYLSPAELARLETAADKDDALLRLWVLKESYSKLTGRGIGNYLKTTDFDPYSPKIQCIDGCYVAVLEEGDTYAV